MSQNSQRLSWTAEEVDAKLHQAMINIHKHSVEAAARYGLGYNLVAGAPILPVLKRLQTLCWRRAFIKIQFYPINL